MKQGNVNPIIFNLIVHTVYFLSVVQIAQASCSPIVEPYTEEYEKVTEVPMALPAEVRSSADALVESSGIKPVRSPLPPPPELIAHKQMNANHLQAAKQQPQKETKHALK